jgi:hypothetical protein
MKLPFLNRRITPLVPITLLFLLLLITTILIIPPTMQISVLFFSFSVLYLVFPLVFLLFFGIGTLIFKSRFHGLLLATTVLCFLLLRLNGLKHPLFTVLLIAIFIVLEFFFAQTGKKAIPHLPARKDQVQREKK